MGKLAKTTVGELGDEVREGFYMCLNKELNGFMV